MFVFENIQSKNFHWQKWTVNAIAYFFSDNLKKNRFIVQLDLLLIKIDKIKKYCKYEVQIPTKKIEMFKFIIQ